MSGLVLKLQEGEKIRFLLFSFFATKARNKPNRYAKGVQ